MMNKATNPERVESFASSGHARRVPQSLSQILVHVIFSTKNRQPFLSDRALREETHKYLGGILEKIDCPPLLIGGVEDHVHLLCSLSRTCDASGMIKEIKRGSSLWLKTKGQDLQDFAWQSGYGIFSVGFSQVDAVREYIIGQEAHHRKVSFQDELRSFLQRYSVDYDEKYVWD